MAKKIPITLACGDYEIIRALKEGEVEPDGIELTVLTEMDSTTRHWRFIRNRDFDMAETSASSYVVAKDKASRSRRCRCFCIAASATASCSSIPRRASRVRRI